MLTFESKWTSPEMDLMGDFQMEPQINPILFLNGTNDFAHPLDSYRIYTLGLTVNGRP